MTTGTIHSICTALTGGGAGSVDAIDPDELDGGEVILAFVATNFYVYLVDATSGAAESSPDVIAFDAGGGDKRAVLREIYSSGLSVSGAIVATPDEITATSEGVAASIETVSTEHFTFFVQSDGTVSIEGASANTSAANVDCDLCIFNTGTQERVVFLERTIRSLRIEKDRLEDENSKIRLELRELKKDSNGDEL